ncbi:MAG: tyrosine-protein phosphatase [Gemmatales bacterium]|nr:tyrosine-protein phosphatase [Gemmatales bacterium]
MTEGRSGRAWRWRRLLMVALLSGLGLWSAPWVYHTWIGTNLHVVVPGRIYRSAQLTPMELTNVVQRLGIRTVINLRGCCEGYGWYERQRETLTALGVEQWDVRFSYRAPPAVPELRRLVEALQVSERPILLHCRRGADRTGLGSSVAVLMEGGDVREARAQFSWYYGWFPWGGPARLPQVLDWYGAWLNERGLAHHPEHFRRWVEEAYRPGHLWAEIVPVEVPERWEVGRSAPARFRVVNRSAYAWTFRTTPRVGVHLRAWLLPEDRPITDPIQLADWPTDAAGFFDAQVSPGEALEIRIGLPRTRQPGRYVLLVDLVDANDGPFCVYGSAAFRRWVEIR